MKGRALLAALLAATLVLQVAAAPAMAAPDIDFDEDKAPNPKIVEDELTVAEHDRADMDGPLEYYNDSGEVEELPATVNSSQDTPFGVRFDKIDADAYTMFPRIDGESGNSANWTVASDWSTNSATVSDADADGVEKIEVDVTGAGGNATLADNVSIDSDVDKRVLFFVGNVDALGGSAEVQVRAVDSDGDFRYANISSDDDANETYSIANGTGNGFVFQQRLTDLPLDSSAGDGSMDSIDKVVVESVGDTATVTIAALDLDKKSTENLAEIQRNTDGDDELEDTTVTNYYEGGVANVTGLDTLGEIYNDAEINDLKVYDVWYQYSDLTDDEEYSVDFSSADDYSYSQKLEAYGDLEVPTAIDLSHGSLSMEFEQGLPDERYVEFRVAEDSDTDEAFGNLSDSDYTDVESTLTGQGDTAELLGSVNADENYRVHMLVLLQDEEADALQSTGAGVGPTGGQPGFLAGLLATTWGKVAALVTTVVGVLGLRRYFG